MIRKKTLKALKNISVWIFVSMLLVQACTSTTDKKDTLETKDTSTTTSQISPIHNQNQDHKKENEMVIDKEEEINDHTSIVQDSNNDVYNQPSSQSTSSNVLVSKKRTSSIELFHTSEERFIPKQGYRVNAEEGANFQTKKGMKVEIPSNCFVDEKGQIVKGKVKVLVKEYYSAAEIIMSNLPMHYNDGKNIYPFESDGMFAIMGTHKNKPVYIARGKAIKMTTKRNKDGQGFDFYKIDKKGDWAKDPRNTIQPLAANTSTEERHINFHKTKPVAPIKFDPDLYTVESDVRYMTTNGQKEGKRDNKTVCQWSINVKENPWILDKSKWVYNEKKSRYSVYKCDSVKSKNRFNQEVMKDTLIEVSFQRVWAVRGTKRYEELFAEYQIEKKEYDVEFKKYQENYEEYLANNQGFKTQALLVSAFGAYNIDRYYSMPQHLIVEKKYKTNINDIKINKVFLLVKNKDGIIPVDLTYYPEILRFNKQDQMALIAMSNKEVYSVEHGAFHLMLKNQMRDEKFKLALIKLKPKNTKDFDNMLAQLF